MLGTAGGIVICLDAGRIVVQFITETRDRIQFVTNQINRAPVERLSGHAGMRVITAVAIKPHVVATVVCLERVILRPGEVIVIEVDVHAVFRYIFDRWAEVVDRG